MSINRYYNPVRSIFGDGALAELPQVAKSCIKAGQGILVLAWDATVADLNGVKQLESLDARLHFHVATCSNPEVSDLFAVYEQTKGEDIALVIGVGGGSILDMAKSLCLLYSADIANEDALRNMIKSAAYPAAQCRWIGVPTTAGTGSEVTCWATIWDSPKNAKYSIATEANYATACITDSELTYCMPLSLAISSALDAMAHAMESYWARATNNSSRIFALQAIRLLVNNIKGLASTPRCKSACSNVAQGSMLAGLAFSNTKTTAGHSISYPLTMKFRIPHGVAVSLVLPDVLKINLPKIAQSEELLQALGMNSPEEFKNFVSSMLSLAGYPTSLSGFGVTADDLSDLAAHSLTPGRADNNPVDLTPNDVVELLRNAL